jgi:hypothetical protein
MLCGLSLFFGKKIFQLAEKDETISCSMQSLLFVMTHDVKNIYCAALSYILLFTITCIYDRIAVEQVISKENTNGAKNLCAGGLHEQKQ